MELFKYYIINPITKQKIYLSSEDILLVFQIKSMYFKGLKQIDFSSEDSDPFFFTYPGCDTRFINPSFSFLMLLFNIPEHLFDTHSPRKFLSNFSLLLDVPTSEAFKPLTLTTEFEVYFQLIFSCTAMLDGRWSVFDTYLKPNITLAQAYDEVITWIESYQFVDFTFYESLQEKLLSLKTNYALLLT